MAPSKPMLGDIELQQVEKIEVNEDQVLAQQSIPALEGDFLQRLGRRSTQISLTGVLTGAEAGAGLKTLQEKFRATTPISFVADIATATKVEKVLIEEMGIRELAGKPERFEYALTLREFTPSPTAEPVPLAPPTPPPPSVETGTLVVNVTVNGQSNFDFSKVTVSVEGTQDDGSSLKRNLTNRSNNSWTEANMPPGKYTAKAVVTDPQALSGTADVTVSVGQTAQANITLQTGSPIAKAFIVHFWFDKAFVEPCMFEVLKTVVDYANAHTDEKLVIVGHTDLVGDADYNQLLSERRGRSVYAVLSYGRDKPTALAEWNAFRQPADGSIPGIKDSWGVREYQYMLQDLDFYSGNIDGVQGPETDAAVRDFQTSKGLTVDGIVGDQTWSKLIEAYLDQYNLTVPVTQFLPNCGGEILKWLGCGEQDPVKNTTDAWRPNRRTELLFVKASVLPCQVPQPETFDMPTRGTVGSKWCLGPGDKNHRNCFATRTAPQAGKWLIQPVEPETITVSGSITFDDGAPAGNMKYVLIAPDGEYMDGEVPRGADHGKPISHRTNDDGTFAYPNKPKGVGIYTMEIIAPVVARTADEPPQEADGNVVCKRLDATTTASAASQQAVGVGAGAGAGAGAKAGKGAGLPVDVSAKPAKRPKVNPQITLASPVVVVKKPYTQPTRELVTLRTSAPFNQSGMLTQSGKTDAIQLFTAVKGGTKIDFNGTDNVFSGTQLTAGVKLFAEGAKPSDKLNDFTLTLTLTARSNAPVGDPATVTMTAVELTLDVALSRTAPATEPPLLSTDDKINKGRFVQVRDPSFSHERAMIIVRPVNPSSFSGTLVLTAINAQVQAFAFEVPATGQVPVPASDTILSGIIPLDGARFFVEGTAVSSNVRDTGFRLGIQGIENECDRVAMTTIQIEMTDLATAAAPALTFTRFGLWDKSYTAAGEIKPDADESKHFIGSDTRKIHFRVKDPSGSGHLSVNWKTLKVDKKADDDAPASQELTLPETAAGSKVFLSRSVMLVTNDTDRDFPTESGLTAPLDTGPRANGQSNHRTRKANIEGFVRGEYSPAAGTRLTLLLPVFNRQPDERKRVSIRVIRYTNAVDPNYVSATDAYIAGQFEHANQHWNQIGIQIDQAATVDRQIPAAALLGGRFPFVHPNGVQEQAVLADLIPLTPDNTLTVVFVHLTGANAYAAILEVNPVPLPGGGTATMDDRFFIFINTTLDLVDETLAHELHHVLFNRTDTATERRFFTFNTKPPKTLVQGTGIVLPDVRIYGRIQNLNSPDPNNDPNKNNIINWARRVRTVRYPAAQGLGPATATTGNKFLQSF